jgi:hypothetical protein
MHGSPFRIAHKTGDGPRYLGSVDGCTLSAPSRGTTRTSDGRRQLNPNTSSTSGRHAASNAGNARTLPGSSKSMPAGTSATTAFVASMRPGSAVLDGRIDRLIRYAAGTCPAAVTVSCSSRNWGAPYEAITIRSSVGTT